MQYTISHDDNDDKDLCVYGVSRGRSLGAHCFSKSPGSLFPYKSPQRRRATRAKNKASVFVLN